MNVIRTEINKAPKPPAAAGATGGATNDREVRLLRAIIFFLLVPLEKLLGGPKRTQRGKLEDVIREDNDNFIGEAAAKTQMIRVRSEQNGNNNVCALMQLHR